MDGYNDWRIVFNTRLKAAHVKDTLVNYVLFGSNRDVGRLLDRMINDSVSHQDDNVLELGNYREKLPNWDELTVTLRNLFDDDPEIDLAWMRLGQSPNDNEIYSGTHTSIAMSRLVGMSDIRPVPASVGPASVRATPTAPATCKCDMAQLMRGSGHDDNCLDRR